MNEDELYTCAICEEQHDEKIKELSARIAELEAANQWQPASEPPQERATQIVGGHAPRAWASPVVVAFQRYDDAPGIAAVSLFEWDFNRYRWEWISDIYGHVDSEKIAGWRELPALPLPEVEK